MAPTSCLFMCECFMFKQTNKQNALLYMYIGGIDKISGPPVPLGSKGPLVT